MSEEYDWDIYEMFKEQIDIQLPQIEAHILVLDDQERVKESVDELFRFFHNYKATSSYLGLTPLHKLVSKVETILGTLREENRVVQEAIIEWLFKVKDQMEVWATQMDKQETELSDVPKDLYNSIKVSKSYTHPRDKLKKLTIIYLDKNKERAKKVIMYLKKISKDVVYTSSLQETLSVLKNQKHDILMTNIDKENFDLISKINEDALDVHTIAIFNKITSLYSKKLLKLGITHSIENPLNAKCIERELISIVKTYYNSKNILIDHKKIYNFIQTLQPLPNTIFQIAQICDDDELHIKDLIKVVKTDPILAANILKVANSPMYGSIELKTIDQAITRLGKRTIKALAMSNIHKSLGTIDLQSYKINEEQFSKVSMMRLSLMLKWYSKVSIQDLSVLSSTALLGNIGQILISKEIKEMGMDDEFANLSNSVDIKYAEESLIHSTTNYVSSQVLNYWNLSKDIIDVIAYTDDPSQSEEEIKKLSVANHIIYTLIGIDGKVLKQIPDELFPMMAEQGLDPVILQNALDVIVENYK